MSALLDALEINPKQYPKKTGELKGRRAAPVVFRDGIVWRAVFEIDEKRRVVRILSLGPHDRAYDDAKKR